MALSKILFPSANSIPVISTGKRCKFETLNSKMFFYNLKNIYLSPEQDLKNLVFLSYLFQVDQRKYFFIWIINF